MAPKKGTKRPNRQPSVYRSTSANLRRHALHKLGRSIEEIAIEEGVRPAAIARSIESVDTMRLLNTPEVMTAEMINSVIGRKLKYDQALEAALDAVIVGKKGTTTPNHNIRLRAVAEVRQMVKALQPRGGGINLNVNNSSSALSSSIASSDTRFIGFEERLREVRAQIDQHNQLPPPDSIAAPEADNEIEEDEVEDGTTNPQGESASE